MYQTIQLQGFSQTYAAKRLGFTQSALSNKLRLLRLSPEIQEKILEFDLTERHARALLRLPEERRDIALAHIIAHNYNVSDTEAYIDKMLYSPPAAERSDICPELRPFYDGIRNAAQTLQSKGHLVEISESGTDVMMTINIHVHRR